MEERLMISDISKEDPESNHIWRYKWAGQACNSLTRALDVGCGSGYGSHILAERGAYVIGFDPSAEAIEAAAKHWGSPETLFLRARLMEWQRVAHVVVAFEVLEHMEEPLHVSLGALMELGHTVFISVPIDEKPHVNPHHRHWGISEIGVKLAVKDLGGYVEESVFRPIVSPNLRGHLFLRILT
jgi:SAM-dependent methyltransferase